MGQQGNIYLVQIPGGPFKIGFTEGPVMGRINPLRSQIGHRLVLIDSFWSDDAIEAESRIHWHFRDKHLVGEWFALDADDVKRFSRFAARLPRKASGRIDYQRHECPLRKVLHTSTDRRGRKVDHLECGHRAVEMKHFIYAKFGVYRRRCIQCGKRVSVRANCQVGRRRPAMFVAAI